MLDKTVDDRDSLSSERVRGQDGELVARIFAGCQPEVLHAGKVLFMQEDPSERIYGLISGTVEISMISADGEKLVANLVQPPSLIGEIGCLDGRERTATAICRTTSSVVSLSRGQLADRIERQPGLAQLVIEFLCDRLRWVSSELGDVNFLDIEARLAKRVLGLQRMMADKHGQVAISQMELAQTLGVTRESINKVLNDWRALGLIEMGRGYIKITDAQRLRTLVLE